MMIIQKRKILIFTALILISISIFSFTNIVGKVQAGSSFAHCSNIEDGQSQVDCVSMVIDQEILSNGINRGLQIFKSAYNTFPAFANDCHNQAHRVGDFVYYKIYLNEPDISKLDFPNETKRCKMGVFHGFFEHLFQDNPDPVFVSNVCEYFKKHVLGTLINPYNIANTCYNGAGHGFQLSAIEKISKEYWGDARLLIAESVDKCEKLRDINPQIGETEERICKEGVFAYIISWMKSGEYGLSYDNLDPFSLCHDLGSRTRFGCYRGMLPGPTSTPAIIPDFALSLLSFVPNEDIKNLLFEVSMSNNISNTIGNMINFPERNVYAETLAQCNFLEDSLYEKCVTGIVRGLFARVNPQEEYRVMRNFCEESVIAERGMRSVCYEKIIKEMAYLSVPLETIPACKKFPRDIRSRCDILEKE